VKKILFHFSKTNEKFDEWVEFGSPRICAFDSKVSVIRKEKEAKKKEKEALRERLALPQSEILLTDCAGVVESSRGVGEETDIPVRQVSAESDGPTETASEQPCVRAEVKLSGVEALKSLKHYGKQRINSGIKFEEDLVMGGGHVAQKEHNANLNGCTDRSVMYETNLPRSFDLMEQHQPMMTSFSGDLALQREGHSRPSYGLAGYMASIGSAPTRPPDFVTALPERASMNVPVHNFVSNHNAQLLSGLDMLAAVTNQHMFNGGPAIMPGSVNYGQGQTSFLQQQPQNGQSQDLAELIQRQRLRPQQLDPSAGFLSGETTNQTNPSPSNQYRW